jgi:hypothetical protein
VLWPVPGVMVVEPVLGAMVVEPALGVTVVEPVLLVTPYWDPGELAFDGADCIVGEALLPLPPLLVAAASAGPHEIANKAAVVNNRLLIFDSPFGCRQ